MTTTIERINSANSYMLAHPLIAAYHEVGHALVAWWLGCTVIRVRLEPEVTAEPGAEIGYTLFLHNGDLEDVDTNNLIVSVAGEVAERICPDWGGVLDDPGAWTPDRQLASDLGTTEDITRAVGCVRAILAPLLGPLEYFARALLERGEISGKRFAGLLARTGHEPMSDDEPAAA